ncbi:MAG: M36 family metallopeptidase, partial [Saprospiraceae bacterium]|nr:M36 family metallopeptidase [Saprospiraceae bacterium]
MKNLTLIPLALLCHVVFIAAQPAQNLTKANSYILNQQGAFKNVSLALEDFHVSSSHISSLSGVEHIYYQQSIDGIDILNAVGSVHINKEQEVAHATSGFLNASGFNLQNAKVLAGLDAINQAAAHFELVPTGETELLEQQENASEEQVYSNRSISKSNITTRLKYVPRDGNLILTWEVFIDKADDGFMYLLYVNAQNGNIEESIPLTVECNFGSLDGQSHENHHSFGPSQNEGQGDAALFAPNSYRVYAIPLEAPNEGGQSLVTAPWNASSPFGWHDTNGAAGAEFTITRGNNVYASEDQDANNIPGYSPDGGSSLSFEFLVDTSMDPSTYLDGSITNLFYMNNIMHDVTHNYGFDEAAGNFQVNNYGNGGVGGDAVNADALDGSGTNNANFGTPSDGSPPRMQMFRWNNTKTTLNVNAPGNISGAFTASGADFNPTSVSVTGSVVLAEPNLGCSAFTNPGAVSGKIALIDRGSCNFTVKVSNAVN